MKSLKHFSVILCVTLVMTLVLTACASDKGSDQDSKPAKKINVTFGTGGTTGAYYIVGAGMGKVINENSDVINIVVQSTKASAENMNLVSSGQMDFGFANADTVYHAYNGTGFMEEGGKKDILGVLALYDSTCQMAIRKNSGINSWDDLKGKKVCLGTPSVPVYTVSKTILSAYGIDPEKDITPFYLTQEEGFQKLTDGDIDATFFMAGAPTAVLTNAASTGNVTLLDTDVDILEDIIKNEMPFATLAKIPSGTYSGIDKDIYSLNVRANIFVRSDVPEDVVYEFLKWTMERFDDVKESHAALQAVDPNTLWQLPIELHPGAKKYYEEAGLH